MRIETRSIAIDRLRTAMMGVVIFGHALLPYLTIPRRFNDPYTHVAFDWVAVLLYAFAMQAFFTTAGFAAAALLANRGTRAFWRNRWLRLGVPLLVAYLLLTPLVRAADGFASAASVAGELAAGWSWVTSLDWLRWGKVYHLWFLASLILFSAIVQFLWRAMARLPRPLVAGTDAVLARWLSGRLPGLWLGVAAAVPMSASYVGGTGQGTDAWMQAAMFLFFAFGWWLRAKPGLVENLTKHVAGPLLLAGLVLPVCVWSTRARLFAEGESDLVLGIVAGSSNGLIAGLVTLALLGWFQRRFSEPSAIGDYLGRASYWYYLVHYPIVIAAGGLLSVAALHPLLKYALSLCIALPLIAGSFELVRRLSLRKA